MNKDESKGKSDANVEIARLPEGMTFLEALAQIQSEAERPPRPSRPQSGPTTARPGPPAGWD